MFDFGLETQVSDSGPLGPLVLCVIGKALSGKLYCMLTGLFLAHLSQRLRVSYCHQPMSVVRRATCVMRRLSSTIASNDISSETARPRALIFGM